MKKAHELLYMSAEAYTDYYIEMYMRWCLSKCADQTRDVYDPDFRKPDMQKIMANASISKWYANEYAKLEARFVKMVTPQHNLISCSSARTIFNSIMVEMYMKFPQPLIEAARQLKINAN